MKEAVDNALDACEEAARAKDPRSKEADRLSDLRNRAQDRGDEATADKLGEQFAELTDAIEKDVAAGVLPIAVVPTLGTTSTAAVDVRST